MPGQEVLNGLVREVHGRFVSATATPPLQRLPDFMVRPRGTRLANP